MLIENQKELQEKLNAILFYLAKNLVDENEILNVLARLKDIYVPEFRHNYSAFFPVIQKIKEEKEYVIDYLADNLGKVKEQLEHDVLAKTPKYKEIENKVSKLIDHINLEISRANYYSSIESKIGDFEAATQLFNKTQESLKKANTELNEANKKANSLQTQLISVLGIFASIIMAFSGALSISTKALETLNNMNLFSVSLIVILCGLVFFNCLFLLLYYIGKLIDKNLFSRCKNGADCNEVCNKKCCFFSKIRKRLPVLFWVNIILISLLLINVTVIVFQLLGKIPTFEVSKIALS